MPIVTQQIHSWSADRREREASRRGSARRTRPPVVNEESGEYQRVSARPHLARQYIHDVLEEHFRDFSAAVVLSRRQGGAIVDLLCAIGGLVGPSTGAQGRAGMVGGVPRHLMKDCERRSRRAYRPGADACCTHSRGDSEEAANKGRRRRKRTLSFSSRRP